MAFPRSIPALVLAALFAAGCASSPPLPPAPLGQDELDQFLAAGRDARTYGITTYRDPAGSRFEFANRVHPHRMARIGFAGPSRLKTPVVRAQTGRSVDCNVLLDSSARQSWLLLASVTAMDYRPFAPPEGEYPDHVLSPVPGYAGVANKLKFDTLHVESPIFFVPPARGGFGPLARAEERPGPDAKYSESRRSLGANTHVVMGAAAMQSFAFVRLDFPARSVLFSTEKTYAPNNSAAVKAVLPMRNWRGRPAVDLSFGGIPILAVVDTAGDFSISLPDTDELPATLVLGDFPLEDVVPSSHEYLSLPPSFPARIGLGILSRFAVVLDFKHRRVWFEDPSAAAVPVASDADNEPNAPVHYRGITP